MIYCVWGVRKMTDFAKKSYVNEFFESIISELQKSKVKAIFSFSSPSWNYNRGFRTYSTDTEVYILLENDWCLVIDYRFIDALDVKFRKLTALEKEEYNRLLVKDWFNTINNIHNWRINKIYRTESCKLEYGKIESISLRSVTKEYNKWLDKNVDLVFPTEETFDQIKFTMSNDKSFIICADDAEVDGYTLMWSEDTNEMVTDKHGF